MTATTNKFNVGDEVMPNRDGFEIIEDETGKVVDFIACSKDGRMREKVEMGLIMRIDAERFHYRDTRHAD